MNELANEVDAYKHHYEQARKRLDAVRKAIEQWEQATGNEANSDVISLADRIRVNAGLKQHDECEVYT